MLTTTIMQFPNLLRLDLMVNEMEFTHLDEIARQCPNLETLGLRFLHTGREVFQVADCPTTKFLHVSTLFLFAPNSWDLSAIFSYFPYVYEVVVKNSTVCKFFPIAYAALGESLPKTVKLLSCESASPSDIKTLLKHVQLTALRVCSRSTVLAWKEEFQFPSPNVENLFVALEWTTLKPEYFINGLLSCSQHDGKRPVLFEREFLSK